MQRTYVSLIAAAALALPLAAQAELNYSFVELKFTEAEIDFGPGELDGDGFALRGSLDINENFFAVAEFADMEYDFRGGSADGEMWSIGGGGHWPINNSWDVVARIALVNQEIEGDDDDSLVLGAGYVAK